MPEIIVLLDNTAQLIETEDIERGLNDLINKPNTDTIASASNSHLNPYFNMMEERGEYLTLSKRTEKKIHNRQEAPKVYQLGGFLIFWRDSFLKRGIYTDKTRVLEINQEKTLMIDSETDFKIVKYLLEKK